ncbi:hypothetical protein [Kitasatospora terrestris]|uniref:Uncharacterized protein n=1 Tax=Kitasatospora terrestris TaxID=258051 RepID=A0ABP9DSE5_9ACTN
MAGIKDVAGAVTRAASAARTKVGGDWARRAIENHPRPAVPTAEPWEISLAGMVGRLPRVPGPAVRLLHLLDGLGQVSIGPKRIGFDGEEVDWERVVEIRQYSAVDLLPDVVVEREVDRIREFLPPVPGRKWLVTKAAEGLLTVALAASEAAERGERLLPCEIVHKNLLGRPRTMAGGLFAASVLTTVPEAGESLVAAARARGIPVTIAKSPRAGTHTERAKRLRATSTRLTDNLRALTARPAADPGAAPPALDRAGDA